MKATVVLAILASLVVQVQAAAVDFNFEIVTDDAIREPLRRGIEEKFLTAKLRSTTPEPMTINVYTMPTHKTPSGVQVYSASYIIFSRGKRREIAHGIIEITQDRIGYFANKLVSEYMRVFK